MSRDGRAAHTLRLGPDGSAVGVPCPCIFDVLAYFLTSHFDNFRLSQELYRLAFFEYHDDDGLGSLSSINPYGLHLILNEAITSQ